MKNKKAQDLKIKMGFLQLASLLKKAYLRKKNRFYAQTTLWHQQLQDAARDGLFLSRPLEFYRKNGGLALALSPIFAPTQIWEEPLFEHVAILL